jgi:protein-disulfide isomerase
MKRIALVSVTLVLIAVAGVMGVSSWGYPAAASPFSQTTPSSVIGNPAASLTIVEFVDYQCPYCQQLHKTLMSVVKDDKDIRVVFRPLPWLKNSGEIATFVVATSKQGKDAELHKALLDKTTPQNLLQVKQVAKDLGIDIARAERDQKDPAVIAQVTDNLNQAKSLNMQSTPALLIGTTLYVPSADTMPDAEQLRTLIQQAKGPR